MNSFVSLGATKTAGSGNWGTAGTWIPPGVPGAGDSVYIPGGANVTLDVNGSCGALNLAGNLTWPATVGRMLTITTSSGLSGNCYSTGTMNGFGGASGQIITIGGILSVTGGTFNTGTGSIIRFNGTGTKTYSNSNNIQTLEVNGSGLTLQLLSNALVNMDLTITSGTLDLSTFTANRTNSGGTLTVGAGATLKIGGTNTFPTNYTTNTLSATSTVEYSGTVQTVSNKSYGHLTLSGSGTKTMPASAMTIAGNFTTSGTVSVTAAQALTVNGNLTIGNGTTFGAASYSHSVKGDFSNGGTFTASTSTFTFNGTSGQNITGSVAPTFNNLALNNSNGLTLGVNTTVGGTLTLTSGNITTGSNTCIINSTGSVSRTSGHIVGNFQKYIATGATSKTFEIGTGTNYTPVAITFGSVSVAGNLTASTAAGDHANIGSSTINSTKSVNRTWTLTNSSITFTNYSATFTFVAGDIDGGASTSNFVVGKYSPSTWTYPTVGTKTATTTQITGVASFSDFQIGEMNPLTLPQYLVGDGVPSASLSSSAPTATTLPNYDPGRDAEAGLLIEKGGAGSGETDPTKYQEWTSGSSGITLNGVVNFVFWSAIKSFQTGKRGIVTGYLLDCNGGSCSQIATATLDVANWSGGSATWVEKTLSFGALSYTVPAGNTLRLKIIVGSDADDDMWFAYATTSYPSRLASGTTYSISGNVFEDVNYGGGAGRSKASSSGVGRQYADVELYNSSGGYVSGTNTDANGDYSFTGLSAGTYYVRVVNDSVRSSRSGWTTNCKPVVTYRTNAASGTAVAVTDYVGGTNPSATDPGKGSAGATFNTTTFVYTAGLTGTAQAVTQCVITSANITGVDFGFNFNTIVHTNNSGQGSLRQVITNMNTLGGDASLAQAGLVAGKDNAVFMISNGTSAAGLRSANNYFSGGVATIVPTSALPTLSTSMVLDAQKQPGWTSAPIIELNGASAGASANGFLIDGAGSVTIRGFVINRFLLDGIENWTGGGNTIQGNYIGTNAAGTAASANTVGIYMESASNTIGGTSATQRNVVSGNAAEGIYLATNSADNNTIQGNHIGSSADGSAAVANGDAGIYIPAGDNNTIGGTSAGAGNLIRSNGGDGIVIDGTTTTNNAILGNSVFGNGGQGIDLDNNGVSANNGTKNASLPNYDMDHPVFTAASLSGTTLTFSGYVGSAPNQSTFANAIVEIFKSDNDASGYGEGQTYLGRDTCDASGNFSGSITVTGLSAGDKITGTATDGSNNTSEFGANFTVTGSYYSKGSLAVNIASNWNTARDGSGTDASSFGTGGTFIIQNTHAMTLTGSSTWDVSASGTVQIESGGSWTNSSSGAVTMGTLQVDNGGSYIHATNNALPGTSKAFGATSTVTYNGSSQTVEALTYGHLTIASAGTRTLGGNATVVGDLSVTGGTLDLSTFTANRSAAGGTITVSNGATLKIGGTNSFPTNYSTTTLGATSTVEYNGAAQSVAGKTYGHLTVSNGNTKTAASAVTVAGDFTIGSATTFDAGSYTHVVQGNWSNSGTFTAGTCTVQLTGNNDASITGATTFNVLEVNKNASATTVTLNNNVTTATLTMTQGKMSTGTNSILVTSSRAGDGLVIGTITRTHTFNAGTTYAFEGPNQTLTFNSGGTLPTSVTVTTTLSSPGANDYMDPIARYYDISQTGGTGFSYTLRLHYEDSEVSAPNSETSPALKIWRRTSTGPDVWTREGATSNNTTNNWVEKTGLTNVGTFSLSSRTVADVVLTLSQNATNPTPGDQVTYTLDYANGGDGASTNTVVTAAAPTNTTYVAGTTRLNGVLKTDAADADEVTVSGSTITINVGTVNAGGSGQITYRVVVN